MTKFLEQTYQIVLCIELSGIQEITLLLLFKFHGIIINYVFFIARFLRIKYFGEAIEIFNYTST